MSHIADNHDALLDYLYEEGDPAERLKTAKHLQECAACAVAVLELQNVRGMLRGWTPPASELGFRIVQDGSMSAPATSPSPSPEEQGRGGWWRGWGAGTPQPKSRAFGFVQAAAAVLLFIAGMAVSQLNVDYGAGAVTVRARATMPPANVRKTSITLPVERQFVPGRAPTLEEIDRLIAQRLESNPSAADSERLFQRVRAMLDQSEQRQQRELALRLSQFSREVDTQHQADVLKIQQDFGQQQEALEYLVRTSGGTK